jgi:predicted O-linked N-acetylglucosamine transferase (SPINDLY family)
VQATWLGYLNTTGLTRIDYRLTDAHAGSTGPDGGAAHREARALPHSQWCYRPFISATAIGRAPPCVRNGYVTFGSFNQVS